MQPSPDILQLFKCLQFAKLNFLAILNIGLLNVLETKQLTFKSSANELQRLQLVIKDKTLAHLTFGIKDFKQVGKQILEPAAMQCNHVNAILVVINSWLTDLGAHHIISNQSYQQRQFISSDVMYLTPVASAEF